MQALMQRKEDDYAVFGGTRVKIERIKFENPKGCGLYLSSIMQSLLPTEEKVFIIYSIGTTKLLMFSSNYAKDSVFHVRLMELRNDGVGMPLEGMKTQIEESHIMPLISLARDINDGDPVFSFHGIDHEPLPNNRIILEAVRNEVHNVGGIDIDTNLTLK